MYFILVGFFPFHTAKLTDGVCFFSLFRLLFLSLVFISTVRFKQTMKRYYYCVCVCVRLIRSVVCNFTMQNMEYVFKSDYYKIAGSHGVKNEEEWVRDDVKKMEGMACTLFIRRIFYQFASRVKKYCVITTKTNDFWLGWCVCVCARRNTNTRRNALYLKPLKVTNKNMRKCTVCGCERGENVCEFEFSEFQVSVFLFFSHSTTQTITLWHEK